MSTVLFNLSLEIRGLTVLVEKLASIVKGSFMRHNSSSTGGMERQVAQSVERRTLEVEVRGSKPALGTWWWGRISPNQPYPKGAVSEATTSLNEG